MLIGMQLNVKAGKKHGEINVDKLPPSSGTQE